MKAITKIFLSAILFSGFCAANLFAQVGNDNPTGVAGEFNGDVTTGCRYDPYTGNAQRTVTDLVVSGGVGAYPLAFKRTSNSRGNVVNDNSYGGSGQNADFGTGGNWLHSYQWTIDPVTKATGAKPTSFNVNYPDGRVVTFTASTNGDPYYRGGPGVHDRLQVFWDSGTAGRAYLIMPDGGKVRFSIAISGCSGTCNFYLYTVNGIIDPYGQTTTITGSVRPVTPGQPGSSVVTITEPGGRWIELHYFIPGGWTSLIDYVLASDGRRIDYTYTIDQFNTAQRLVQVNYYNDPTLVATYTYQADNSNSGGNYLLSTCIDPMYAGPMWKIAYNYATGTNPDGTAVVYGQILSENYFDGTNRGAAVSTLTKTGTTTRKETRADGKTRTFTYNPTPLLISWTDFRGVSSSQTYDANSYVNSVTDRNGHTTNLTKNAFTGGLLTTTFPSTPGDTPPNTPRGVMTYTYGSSTCPDPNNRDANNPYYIYSITDEGGHVTTYLRDTSKRVTQINYPDGGTESFIYNSFGQATSHTLRTGGTDSFTYDARGLRQTYRDAYHATGNPSMWYQYDGLDRVSGVTDALGASSGDANHTTNYTYNSRGQLLTTTHPVDPGPNNGGSTDAQAGQRYTITNAFNPNGTLASKTDEENHATSFTYDDYRRLRSVTTPGHNTPLTAYAFYDANGVGEDYTHADSNPTWLVSPSQKKTKSAYREDYLRTSVTQGFGTTDAATTSYGYDNVGNVTSMLSPNEQVGQIYSGFSTTRTYDERNRTMSITDAHNGITTFKYDAAGRMASVTRSPSGQVTTYDSYDVMNRLLQQTVKQTPDPDAVTKYTYYTSGLLHTMQDPRLVATNSSYSYSYTFDQMGRETSLMYPPDSGNVQRTESWHYDTAGRVDTLTNRAGNLATFAYDPLTRLTGASWNDGLTPSVTLAYDVASRMTKIVNSNATTVRTYFNDNLLNAETSTYVDNTPRTVTYTYDQDYNRATIQYANGAYSFTYNYTGRNQLLNLINNSGNGTVATYSYDRDGNVAYRSLDNGTSSSYTNDVLDRVIHISHSLTGTTRTFDYGYDSVGNRLWTKRDAGNGDVFGYDLNDQSTSVLLNVPNPDTTAAGPQTISYDANGNRTSFSAYGSTDTYTIDNNSLNQYHLRNSSSATYDANGNMTAGFDNSTRTYDAQNRLLTATKGGTTDTFAYDGLNRQVKRVVGGSSPVYNVYDGWNLIGEYAAGSTSPSNAYLFSASGMMKNLVTNQYYYQDASGSTSHLADNTGHLLEWYRYDLQGTPIVYNATNQQLTTAPSVRHLFTGQQWYSEIGLYDLRFRAYSPDIGRFLQPDPIRFFGDRTNLYRYAHNNPQKWADPVGLGVAGPPQDDHPIDLTGVATAQAVEVTGSFPDSANVEIDIAAGGTVEFSGGGDRSGGDESGGDLGADRPDHDANGNAVPSTPTPTPPPPPAPPGGPPTPPNGIPSPWFYFWKYISPLDVDPPSLILAA